MESIEEPTASLVTSLLGSCCTCHQQPDHVRNDQSDGVVNDWWRWVFDLLSITQRDSFFTMFRSFVEDKINSPSATSSLAETEDLFARYPVSPMTDFYKSVMGARG